MATSQGCDYGGVTDRDWSSTQGLAVHLTQLTHHVEIRYLNPLIASSSSLSIGE